MNPLSKSKICSPSWEKYVLPIGFTEKFSFGSMAALSSRDFQLLTLTVVSIIMCDATLSPYVPCCIKEMLFAFSERMHFTSESTDPNTEQAKLSTALCFSVTSCTPAG